MSPPVFTEGEADFHIVSAGKTCKTWYRIYGDLSRGRPLVALHGGPGLTHDCILPLVDITSAYSIPLIFYDQIGNGRSTHLPEKNGDRSFWTVELFLNELENLLIHLKIVDDYDIIGHSWGGMLGASHAIRKPKGLNRLVLADSLPDMDLWLQAQWDFRKNLPEDVQETLAKHESTGSVEDPEYQAAFMPYLKSNVCRVEPLPNELITTLQWRSKDPTVSNTMCVYLKYFVAIHR